NLFMSSYDGQTGVVFEFTPDGVQSTFASGLLGPSAMVFDSAGNLFVTDDSSKIINYSGGGGAIYPTIGSGVIYKFTPNGVRSTLTSGLLGLSSLAFDGAG